MNLSLALDATKAVSESVHAQSFRASPFLRESIRVLCRSVRNLDGFIVGLPPKTVPQVEEVIRANHPLASQETNGCKALLLEIIRRAAYDWVLYRTSERMPQKKLAHDAYQWLFQEAPGHANWIERRLAKKEITSFLAICEALDLDPDSVRVQIRKLTVKNVMSVGRPAEYRRTESREEERQLSTEVVMAFQQFEAVMSSLEA